MVNSVWWKEIEAVIMEKSLLKHPFYQAWTMGTLTREDLCVYARQYYQQESRFPRFVSAVHSNCPELKVRQELLKNLNEEESGPENHPELWLRFAQAVGASRESVGDAVALPQTVACISAFDALSRSKRWWVGLAALYAYEAQQPDVARTKIEGLKARYGLHSKDALGFFEVHQAADAWHSEVEKQILMRQADRNPGVQAEIWDAVSEACNALNTLLDGVCQVRGIYAPSLN